MWVTDVDGRALVVFADQGGRSVALSGPLRTLDDAERFVRAQKERDARELASRRAEAGRRLAAGRRAAC